MHEEFSSLFLRRNLLINLVELGDALFPLLRVLHFSSPEVHLVRACSCSAVVTDIATADALALTVATSTVTTAHSTV